MKYNQPDHQGHFNKFGGRYVPEALIPAIGELEKLYLKVSKENSFQKELMYLQKSYSGRPTPLYFAKKIF